MSKLTTLGLTAAIGLTATFLPHASTAQPVVIVAEERPMATIVVAADAPAFTREAAEELAYYIQEISGVPLDIATSADASVTESVIWVGPHQELAQRQEGLDLTLTQPEETIIQTAGKDIIILGRDNVGEDGNLIEAGTRLAVSSFIEEQLGVRWLWPGEFGTDIPKSQSITIQPTLVRYTPQVHLRRFNMVNYERSFERLRRLASDGKRAALATYSRDQAREQDIQTRKWLNHQRLDAPQTGQRVNAIAGSMFNYQNRHAFLDWYKRYGKKHPTWFAQQPDGTRTPFPTTTYVKMCVSNPEVAEQWVQNAKAFFLANPNATTFEAGENDRGWEGYCVCEDCLAIDNKNAEILEREIRWKGSSKQFYALTDRYAQFWNQIAKRLKEEFPDRDVNVATYAYHVTRPAPTIKLEPNIIPAFVGLERRFYHRNNQEHTLDQRRMWQQWWEAVGRRDALVWRPNMMYITLGLPYIFTQRHADNMRFMAEHGLVGATFNSTFSYWATQGPQLYLTAKLLWNPMLDADAVLTDYYQRAFGPAAPHVAAYYQEFEDLYAKLAEQYGDLGFAAYSDPPRLYREARKDSKKATRRLGQEGVKRNTDVEDRAQMHLNKAMAAVANSDAIYAQRLEFVKTGFDYIQAQLDAIEAMNAFTENPTPANRKRAEETAQRRAALLDENSQGFALNYLDAILQVLGRQQFLGPPQKEATQKKTDEQTLVHDLEA